jgi:hypothetical protein
LSGYVEAGYLVVTIGLGGYAVSLLARQRAARARLQPRRRPPVEERPEPEEKR